MPQILISALRRRLLHARTVVAAAAVVVALAGGRTLTAQEAPPKSATPADINKNFLDPDLNPEEWLERFEIESREVFSQRKQILQALGLKQGQAVADVGAGTGLYLSSFAKSVGQEGRVYAVDISPKFVDFLRARAREQSLENVQVVLSKEESTELPAASVDAVFVCDTYHHFEYHIPMLKSIFQALKPGGQLVIIDFERIEGKSREWIMGHVRAGKDQVRREVELAGFEFAEEVTIPEFQENYFLRFRKPGN